MLEARQNEHGYAEYDADNVVLLLVYAYGEIHEHAAEQAAYERLRKTLTELSFTERLSRIAELRQRVSYRVTAGDGTDRVAEQSESESAEIFLIVRLDYEAYPARVKRISFEADTEQCDGEHHGTDVSVVTGEEHRASDAYQYAGADAGEYLFQIRHIFSSLSFTSPTI